MLMVTLESEVIAMLSREQTVLSLLRRVPQDLNLLAISHKLSVIS